MTGVGAPTPEPDDYWPMTEAHPLLTTIEQAAYEQSGVRPFYQWNGDPKALTPAGEKALAAIKALLVEVQDALY